MALSVSSHACRNRQYFVVVAEGLNGNGRDHGGECGIDQVVTQQNGGQQLVCLPQQFENLPRPPAALSSEIAHSIAVDRHQTGLGHREERRYQQEQQEG